MFIQITDQEKAKCFLYNPIASAKRYINVLTSFDLLLTKKGCQVGAILKEIEILEHKEAIANKEKYQKDGRVGIEEVHQERDQLIKSMMSVFNNFLHLKFLLN